MGAVIGILKYRLPAEAEEFKLAQRGAAYKGALEAIDNKLRGILKYEADRLSEATATELQEIRKFVLSEIHEAEEA